MCWWPGRVSGGRLCRTCRMTIRYDVAVLCSIPGKFEVSFALVMIPERAEHTRRQLVQTRQCVSRIVNHSRTVLLHIRKKEGDKFKVLINSNDLQIRWSVYHTQKAS